MCRSAAMPRTTRVCGRSPPGRPRPEGANDELIDGSEGSISDRFLQDQADARSGTKRWDPGDASAPQGGLEANPEGRRLTVASDGYEGYDLGADAHEPIHPQVTDPPSSAEGDLFAADVGGISTAAAEDPYSGLGA